MSEYQYYEFQAIDRPLHEAEQAEISRLSRRVTLTPRQAVFTYSYGDFPGNAIDVLGKYFDSGKIGSRAARNLLCRSQNPVGSPSGEGRPTSLATSPTFRVKGPNCMEQQGERPA